MKKVLVLSFGQRTSDSICEAIKKVVGQELNVRGINVKEDFKSMLDDETLLVITSEHIAEYIINKLPGEIEYLVAKRVINYQFIEDLIHIRKGEDVLLVNDHEATCHLTIEQLIKHGINHVNYMPYYPGCDVPENVKIAVTPNESHLVPKGIETVIDIGTRQIDIISIFEIAKWLEVPESRINTMSSEFVSEIVLLLKQFNSAAKSALEYKNILQGILDNSNNGIVYCDLEGRIIVANIKAQNIFDKEIESGVDFIQNLWNEELDIEALRNKKLLVKINEIDYLATAKAIDSKELSIGYHISFQNVSEVVKDSYDIRRQKRKGKHRAIYNFDDIIGESKALNEVINLAKKLSLSKSAILIEGESGTGKELFAQSIHQNSKGQSEPFVAINCASLSASLLESELFGYEKGSFTGATRQGKAGLFEQAHKGTIFLDEIGDTTLDLQSKLLRVLQEKEVRRIGGEKTIPIDVRVIAATNKPLQELVKRKVFRNDLYYRINVLPLNVPSLKNRKEDVPILLDFYLKKSQGGYADPKSFFTVDAYDYLCNYQWPGNVRELMNVVEYLVSIKEVSVPIDIEDLPRYILHEQDTLDLNKLTDDQYWILEMIGQHNGIGRRRINALSQISKPGLTEGRIRGIMEFLAKNKLIEVSIGQKGTVVSELGKLYLNSGL